MEAARNLQVEKAVMTLSFVGPDKGFKYRGIKDTDGEWWNVLPHEIEGLRPGQTYHVEFSRNAKGYRNVESIVPAMPPAQRQSEPIRTPALQTNGNKMDQQYWSPKPRNPAEQKQIWVNSMLGREIEMGRGFMTKEQLVARGKVHAEVWDSLFGDEPTNVLAAG